MVRTPGRGRVIPPSVGRCQAPVAAAAEVVDDEALLEDEDPVELEDVDPLDELREPPETPLDEDRESVR